MTSGGSPLPKPTLAGGPSVRGVWGGGAGAGAGAGGRLSQHGRLALERQRLLVLGRGGGAARRAGLASLVRQLALLLELLDQLRAVQVALRLPRVLRVVKALPLEEVLDTAAPHSALQDLLHAELSLHLVRAVDLCLLQGRHGRRCN